MNKIIILLFLSGLFLVSCQTNNERKVEKVQVFVKKPEIEIHRYEKALFAIDPSNLKPGLSNIYTEYKFFMGDEWYDTLNLLRIYNYVSDPNIKGLYDLEIKKFPNTEFLRKGLQDAFNRIEKFYPDIRLPMVYTYVSGLDVDLPVIYSDTIMAISMDLFLGSDVPAYRKAGIPEYKIARFTPEHLIPACIRAVSDSIVKTDVNKQSLLDQMIAAGKILYLMDMILPDVKDEYKIGYTYAKLTWCNENEENIWEFLVGNQLLFSSDPQVSAKMMVDAPFTSGFVTESPGRLGEWIGWQIVKAYMEENLSQTLPELMKNTDAQMILQGSKYKPRK